MRITTAQARDLGEHARRLLRGRTAITAAFEAFTAAVNAEIQKLNEVVCVHNCHVEDARKFVDGVAAELRDELDEKSDRWKESDAGQMAEAMVGEWEDARLEDVAAVEVVMPDPPHFEESLNLPEDNN